MPWTCPYRYISNLHIDITHLMLVDALDSSPLFGYIKVSKCRLHPISPKLVWNCLLQDFDETTLYALTSFKRVSDANGKAQSKAQNKRVAIGGFCSGHIWGFSGESRARQTKRGPTPVGPWFGEETPLQWASINITAQTNGLLFLYEETSEREVQVKRLKKILVSYGKAPSLSLRWPICQSFSTEVVEFVLAFCSGLCQSVVYQFLPRERAHFHHAAPPPRTIEG